MHIRWLSILELRRNLALHLRQVFSRLLDVLGDLRQRQTAPGTGPFFPGLLADTSDGAFISEARGVHTRRSQRRQNKSRPKGKRSRKPACGSFMSRQIDAQIFFAVLFHTSVGRH